VRPSSNSCSTVFSAVCSVVGCAAAVPAAAITSITARRMTLILPELACLDVRFTYARHVVVGSTSEQTEVQAVPGPYAPGVVLFAKFRVEDTLGVGGYGLVVRARDLMVEREVAIKILRTEAGSDAEQIQRFLREAQTVVRLRSEYTVRVSDVGTLEDGAP